MRVTSLTFEPMFTQQSVAGSAYVELPAGVARDGRPISLKIRAHARGPEKKSGEPAKPEESR